MLLAASIVSVLIMLIVPIVLVIYLIRKLSISWKLALAGVLTFIASQVLHIPLTLVLPPLFQNGTLSIPATWTTILYAVVLGLLAGIFEETARWILYKFILKNAKSWNEGVLVGAGHGGVESFLLGLLAILTLVNLVIMRNADLAALGVPAEQIELARQQVDAFWASPFYTGFLGGLERIFAICLHLSLSLMVLYSVAYKKPIWFWLALFWHAFVDASAVYLLPIVGAVALEGIVGVFAIASLFILFRLKPMFVDEESAPAVIEA